MSTKSLSTFRQNWRYCPNKSYQINVSSVHFSSNINTISGFEYFSSSRHHHIHLQHSSSEPENVNVNMNMLMVGDVIFI